MPVLVIRRRAFTLIELLVVMSIMAVIAGLMLVGARAIRGDARKRATEGILAACHQALELHSAEKGGYPGATRHPGWWLPLNHEPIPGVAKLGNPMLSEQPVAVYADARLPLIYGSPSDRATLLGSDLAAVTGRDRDSQPEEGERYLSFVLGFGNAIAELHRQDALRTRCIPFGNPDKPNLLRGGFDPTGAWEPWLLWTPESPTGGTDRWKPGRIATGHVDQPALNATTLDRWLEYQLPGTAIYDAWGREIFYYFDKKRNAFGFLSAGADGCLVWEPGDDFTYATAATDTGPGSATGSPFPGQGPGSERRSGGSYASPSGDDRWAGRDNVFVGMQ